MEIFEGIIKEFSAERTLVLLLKRGLVSVSKYAFPARGNHLITGIFYHYRNGDHVYVLYDDSRNEYVLLPLCSREVPLAPSRGFFNMDVQWLIKYAKSSPGDIVIVNMNRGFIKVSASGTIDIYSYPSLFSVEAASPTLPQGQIYAEFANLKFQHLQRDSQFSWTYDPNFGHTISFNLSDLADAPIGNLLQAYIYGGPGGTLPFLELEVSKLGMWKINIGDSCKINILPMAQLLEIQSTLIKLNQGTEPFVLGLQLQTFLTNLITWLATHTHVCSAPGAPSGVPSAPPPSLSNILSNTIFGS
ncbi:MAG: hypothetical protein QW228_01430 [Candidatus Aenigmatarchaeota archaeon]